MCVPAYNAGKTLAGSLTSILAQRYANFSVLVLDNCSTDNTVDVARSVAVGRATIIVSAFNCGAEGNFTRCIEVATGKYTAIFHADDLYEADMLEKQVAYLEAHEDVGAVFTEAQLIDHAGRRIGSAGKVPGRREEQEGIKLGFKDVVQTMMLHHNFLVSPSALVRTEIYKEVIKVWGTAEFGSASDIDTWLRVARHSNIAVLPEPLMKYRISAEQFSNRNRNRTTRMEFFNVIDHYVGLPEVRDKISVVDLRNYAWLERHDRVARAMNLFAQGKSHECEDLLEGTLRGDAFRAAISTRRGLVTLAAAILLTVSLPFAAWRPVQVLIRGAKQLRWR